MDEIDLELKDEIPDDVDFDPPKFLADLFESVAGAIYLDSNCSLNAVWKSYYSMLEPYLGKNWNYRINRIWKAN